MVKDLNRAIFNDEIASAKVPVIVDFWASWCGPCRALAPVLHKLADELGDRVSVCKVNVDEEGELAQRFEVMTIPTLIVFKNGVIAKRVSGLQSLDALKAMVTD